MNSQEQSLIEVPLPQKYKQYACHLSADWLKSVAEDGTYLSKHSDKNKVKNCAQEQKDEMQIVAHGG